MTSTIFVVYKYLTGRSESESTGLSEKKNLKEFHLFSQLPSELRIHIWELALPERTVEASLRCKDQHWECAYLPMKHTPEAARRRQLPTLFTVNVESREVCMKNYIAFGNTYIHPELDFLYISWHWDGTNTPWGQVDGPSQSEIKFWPIQGQPLSKFKKIAITIGRSPNSQSRFGALIDCLRSLGTPRELLLALVGPNLPSVNTLSIGFSISNGNRVALLDWPPAVESNMANEVRELVMAEFEVEMENMESFKLPQICNRLHYIYSGP